MESEKNPEFLSSIDSFDLSCTEVYSDNTDTVLKKKKKGLDLTRLIVILICLAVFAYSSYSLIQIYTSNLQSESLYGDIYSSFADVLSNGISLKKDTVPSQSSLLSSSPYVPSKGGSFNAIENGSTSLKFQQALSKLESLRSQNRDIVGFISISGTGINYPLLQCADNDYYLKHGFDRTYMKSGSIFYDFRSDPIPDNNRNLIIYGHNMANGSMFQQLEHYTENEEIFKGGTITIYSFEGIYTYEIFSVYFTSAYANYLDIAFRSDNDFVAWCEDREMLSLYKKDVEFDKDSHIVSLSTCVNATSDGRIAVHGVLTNVER